MITNPIWIASLLLQLRCQHAQDASAAQQAKPITLLYYGGPKHPMYSQ
jgi:hypothetical protein